MSSTNRGAQRHPDDYYATPPWVVDGLLDKLDLTTLFWTSAWWIDPGCGDGAILDRVAEHGVSPTNFIGIETHHERAGQASKLFPTAVILTEDYLGDDVERYLLNRPEGPFAIIANPPYVHAMEFVRRSLALLKTRNQPGAFAAFLLRLAFLESKGREQFHIDNPSHVFVLSGRPSFCHSFKCKPCDVRFSKPTSVDSFDCPQCMNPMGKVTTDSSAYAWFVWGDKKAGRWEIL